MVGYNLKRARRAQDFNRRCGQRVALFGMCPLDLHAECSHDNIRLDDT
jgi:hypothetical protein